MTFSKRFTSFRAVLDCKWSKVERSWSGLATWLLGDACTRPETTIRPIRRAAKGRGTYLSFKPVNRPVLDRSVREERAELADQVGEVVEDPAADEGDDHRHGDDSDYQRILDNRLSILAREHLSSFDPPRSAG